MIERPSDEYFDAHFVDIFQIFQNSPRVEKHYAAIIYAGQSLNETKPRIRPFHCLLSVSQLLLATAYNQNKFLRKAMNIVS